jgi:hypothetical protein
MLLSSLDLPEATQEPESRAESDAVHGYRATVLNRRRARRHDRDREPRNHAPVHVATGSRRSSTARRAFVKDMQRPSAGSGPRRCAAPRDLRCDNHPAWSRRARPRRTRSVRGCMRQPRSPCRPSKGLHDRATEKFQARWFNQHATDVAAVLTSGDRRPSLIATREDAGESGARRLAAATARPDRRRRSRDRTPPLGQCARCGARSSPRRSANRS